MYQINRYTLDQAEELRQNISQNQHLDWKGRLKDLFADPKNIALFAYMVLPESFSREFTGHHYDFFDFIQIGIRSKKNKAAKLPRGFGKSSMVTKLGCIYEAIYQTHNYFVVNSYNDKMSIDKLRLIREEFESNEIIRWLYGEPSQNKDEWQKSSIIVFGNVRFQTISTGQNPRGMLWKSTRPSKVVSDDILDDTDVKNPEIREAAKEWYLKSLLPALTPDGIAEFINTPLHQEDLIETVFKGEGLLGPEKWDTLHIQALTDGKSIDENWKSTEELLLIEKLDPITFSQEYQGIPVSVKSGMVQLDDFRFYESLPKLTTAYIHVDCTHTGKETSDYFACGCLGEHTDRNIYLADFVMGKMDVEKQARSTIGFYIKMLSLGIKIRKMTYDEKANQGFGFWIKKLAKEEYNISLPIEELKYPSDKVSHFMPHVPHFKANRVYLPQNHPLLKTLTDQLTAFPQKGVHDDGVDLMSGLLDNFHTSFEPKSWFY